MDARPFDVLEQPRDQHALAVRDGVHVDLDALEVAVDAHRPVRIHDGGGRELPQQVLGRIAEVDREAADDEARPHDDRVRDPLCQGQRLLDAVGHAALRLRDAEPVEERREARPFLGLVDRFEVAAEEVDATGGQRPGQIERSLATERDHRRDEAAVGRLCVDHGPDRFGIERLEVQPRRGIEVGRHGLGVRVDHHGLPAGGAQRVRRLDRAVVELDPLPDAHRSAADDEGRGPFDGRRLRR